MSEQARNEAGNEGRSVTGVLPEEHSGPICKGRVQIDIGSNNPRMQCAACGRWMRLHGKRLEVIDGQITEVAVQRFYGGCTATGGGDHPFNGDVCWACCPDKCRQRLEGSPADLGGSLAESAD